MKHETEFREILALQAQIQELKKEVSARLGKIKDEKAALAIRSNL